MNLWQGKFDCASTDSRTSWAWAVLQGDIWKTHGQDVANCTPYLPGSFDRPPHNPAEKINSGYKAWEFLLYIFGLGPGLPYGVLPQPIWRSFCKLVSDIRTIYQLSTTRDQLRTAHLHLIEFTAEFETLYVQRRADRIHFVRQSIHSLSHLAPEASRIEPGICYNLFSVDHGAKHWKSHRGNQARFNTLGQSVTTSSRTCTNQRTQGYDSEARQRYTE